MLREQFVQFAVREFLDSRKEQLEGLRDSLVSLPLADERCSLMTERVEGLSEGLMEQQTWRGLHTTYYHSIILRNCHTQYIIICVIGDCVETLADSIHHLISTITPAALSSYINIMV